jgi:hypothetical protein
VSRATEDEDEARWGLLHDAEWALGDLPSPIHHHPALAPYRRIEERIEQAIIERFELTVSDKIRAAVRSWTWLPRGVVGRAGAAREPGELIGEWTSTLPDTSRATAHRLLDRLISSGYIRTERQGRQVRNHLTAEGGRRVKSNGKLTVPLLKSHRKTNQTRRTAPCCDASDAASSWIGDAPLTIQSGRERALSELYVTCTRPVGEL